MDKTKADARRVLCLLRNNAVFQIQLAYGPLNLSVGNLGFTTKVISEDFNLINPSPEQIEAARYLQLVVLKALQAPADEEEEVGESSSANGSQDAQEGV